MVFPATWVDAPARTPRPATILDVLPVIIAPAHFFGIQFQADPCVFPSSVQDGCVVPVDEGGDPTVKSFGDPTQDVESGNFAGYAGVECFLNGDLASFHATAQRILELGEYRVVEDAVVRVLATGTNVGNPTSVVDAFATLEKTLANNVPGRGVIYAAADIVTQAVSQNLLVRNLDGTLETYLGTPVVVLTTPGIPANRVYASGPATIWRSATNVVDAPNPTINMGTALAERVYAFAIECGQWLVAITEAG